jgi:hypothetical protein
MSGITRFPVSVLKVLVWLLFHIEWHKIRWIFFNNTSYLFIQLKIEQEHFRKENQFNQTVFIAIRKYFNDDWFSVWFSKCNHKIYIINWFRSFSLSLTLPLCVFIPVSIKLNQYYLWILYSNNSLKYWLIIIEHYSMCNRRIRNCLKVEQFNWNRVFFLSYGRRHWFHWKFLMQSNSLFAISLRFNWEKWKSI